MSHTAHMLQLCDLVKTYRGPGSAGPVLDGVSFSLAKGQTMALRGESGSGKSTLLHLIAGLDTADSGQIIFAGKHISRLPRAARARLRREDIALIFQSFNLIPSLNVRQNLGFHARLAGRFDATRVQQLADRLGLGDLLDRMPDQISGGQRQRVAIGRAIALRPRLLLADEPTGNLDEDTAAAVMGELLTLVQQSGAALLVATHSDAIAGMLGETITLRRGALVCS